MSKILIIDDERAIRRSMRDILEMEKYKVDDAENGTIALELLKKNKYDVVFCDIKMPETDGFDVLQKSKDMQIETPFVMISGHGDIETAVTLIKNGAYDYIEKPIDLNRMLTTIRNAIDKNELVQETKILRKKVKKQYDIIGKSPAIQSVKEMIEKVAPTPARVLITGENGTGKELVARWLHAKSERNKQPFVEVNCAAIPSELIESELFGHEKGAFTSAIKQRKGKFESAHGGTLFLDEIGDMSLSAQAKVLRALQEHKITRVGGDKDINVDVRVIAATNKDLKQEIANNTFREDLYHRLSVIVIKVPSLNARIEDIPLLANHFLNQISTDNNMPPKSFDESALNALQKKNWTGNVREFRNVVERLMILSDKIITVKDVEQYVL